ncbi:MAG TPA: hypothetical protein VI299_00735 [Polyangiales bacterium]
MSVFFALAATPDYVFTTSLSLAFYLAAGLVAYRLSGHGRYVRIAIAVIAVPLSLLSLDTLARFIASLIGEGG